jgi:hypothetical protein
MKLFYKPLHVALSRFGNLYINQIARNGEGDEYYFTPYSGQRFTFGSSILYPHSFQQWVWSSFSHSVWECVYYYQMSNGANVAKFAD